MAFLSDLPARTTLAHIGGTKFLDSEWSREVTLTSLENPIRDEAPYGLETSRGL
jgi:hypothetical protein